MTAFLLSVIAIFSYYAGSVNSMYLASNLVFHKDITAYGWSNLGITRFLNDYGYKGVLKIALVVLVQVAVPIIISGLLMLIVKQPEIGRAFSLFCILMGNVFPIMYRFEGQNPIPALVLGSFAVSFGLGFIVVVSFAAVYFFTRYISLSAMVSVFVMYVMSIVTIDVSWVHNLCLICTLIVIVAYRKSIIPLLRRQEPKFIYKKDLSYMFDDE